MAISDIRQDFCRLSGRHDLVIDFASGVYTDNGANFYINMGQKMLDRKNRIPMEAMRYQKNLTAGQFQLNITNVRAIKEIWATNGDGRNILTKRDIGYLKENYATAWGSYTRGTPADWAIGVSALAPQQDQLTSGNYTGDFTYDYEDLILSDSSSAPHYNKASIIVMPPVDSTYTISVWGRFFQKKLTDTAGETKNYWTEVHPELLTLSALWAHEVTNRNTEGAKDWMAAIDEYIMGIEKDQVDEEITSSDTFGNADQVPG